MTIMAILLILLIRGSGGSAYAADVIDKIAVIVNDEIITESDIDEAMGPLYLQYKSLYEGDALMENLQKARHLVMNQLIDQKILLSKAKQEQIEVTEDELQGQLETVKKRFESEEKFKETIARQGLTIRQLLLRYKDQLLIRKLISKRVAPKVAVSPAEVNSYYETHKEQFIEPEKAHLANILIRITDERPPEEAYKRAQEVLQKIKEGGSFADLAREYSDGPGKDEGGDMGMVKRGELMSALDEAVFKLEPGQFSDILQSPVGYHIFKMGERQAAVTRDISQARAEIERELFDEALDQEVNRWVKVLRKDAYIAFK